MGDARELGKLLHVSPDDVQQMESAMERARDPHDMRKRSVAWLPEIDRILIVGMKHGSQGIREATNRVLSLRAGFTRADCWKRLRTLRENGNGNHPAPRNWPAEIKELLREGYQAGGEKKQQALKAVRDLYPGLASNTPSRFARRQGWLPKLTPVHPRRPWTEHDERKLWELAGYETAARIGERLGRSEAAVRFRLKSLGLSVRVKDGWSFRALQEMLHIGPSKLRRFIIDGWLRVRDPRVSTSSLATLMSSRIASADNLDGQELPEAMLQKLANGPQAYSWASAAKLLGAELQQVQNWIVRGQLKIVDGFVTERAFQEFCEKRGSEINCELLGNEVRDWLVEGYSLRVHAESVVPAIPGNQKHALITRHCPKCKRPIRGNIFFRHTKDCKGIALPQRSEMSLGNAVPSRTISTSM